MYSIINSLYMMWNQKRPPHFETYQPYRVMLSTSSCLRPHKNPSPWVHSLRGSHSLQAPEQAAGCSPRSSVECHCRLQQGDPEQGWRHNFLCSALTFQSVPVTVPSTYDVLILNLTIFDQAFRVKDDLKKVIYGVLRCPPQLLDLLKEAADLYKWEHGGGDMNFQCQQNITWKVSASCEFEKHMR